MKDRNLTNIKDAKSKTAAANYKYKEKVIIDKPLLRLLEASDVCPDKVDKHKIIAMCRDLEGLELVESKTVTKIKDGTHTCHYIFTASDQLKEMLDDLPSF